MPDSRLRELERKWKESGSVEDEVAYLIEKARVGEIDATMLWLAADFGYDAACTASERAPLSRELPFDEWIARLQEYGTDALLRAAIAVTEHTSHFFADQYSASINPLINVIHVTKICLLLPNDSNRAMASEGISRAQAASTSFEINDDAQLAVWATMEIVSAVYSQEPLFRQRNAIFALNYCVIQDSIPGGITQEAALSIIAQSLTPWALGYSDPIRESLQNTKPLPHP